MWLHVTCRMYKMRHCQCRWNNLLVQGTLYTASVVHFLGTSQDLLLFHLQHPTFMSPICNYKIKNLAIKNLLRHLTSARIYSINFPVDNFTSRKKAVNSGYETRRHNTSVGCVHNDDGDQSAKQREILAWLKQCYIDPKKNVTHFWYKIRIIIWE